MSAATDHANVIFRVAAGPRCGFGHLVRCRSLARALGVEPRVSVRGTAATRAIASSFGWTVVDVDSDARLEAARPALLVVDDPSAPATTEWVQRARRLGVPVATIHDLGRDYSSADLIVDGSITRHNVPVTIEALLGPAFAILHPDFASVRRPRPQALRVLIALGGGTHVRKLAGRLSTQIARRVTGADIHVARGFVSGGREQALAAGQWVSAPDGLFTELTEATVAVVAGGVTLYEACALGAPVVGLAVTAAQHQTVRAMAHRAAVIDGGPPSSDLAIVQTAESVARLLSDERLRARYSKVARALVDGRGALRVAERLRRLMTMAPASARFQTKRGARAA
jgi:spore coat polysaccharide biosynthesis predicted glycosyltransferase SpsG